MERGKLKEDERGRGGEEAFTSSQQREKADLFGEISVSIKLQSYCVERRLGQLNLERLGNKMIHEWRCAGNFWEKFA